MCGASCTIIYAAHHIPCMRRIMYFVYAALDICGASHTDAIRQYTHPMREAALIGKIDLYGNISDAASRRGGKDKGHRGQNCMAIQAIQFYSFSSSVSFITREAARKGRTGQGPYRPYKTMAIQAMQFEFRIFHHARGGKDKGHRGQE